MTKDIPEGYSPHKVSEAAKVVSLAGMSALMDYTAGREKAAAVQLTLARFNTDEPIPSPTLVFTPDGLAETINGLAQLGITTFGPLFSLFLLEKIAETQEKEGNA